MVRTSHAHDDRTGYERRRSEREERRATPPRLLPFPSPFCTPLPDLCLPPKGQDPSPRLRRALPIFFLKEDATRMQHVCNTCANQEVKHVERKTHTHAFVANLLFFRFLLLMASSDVFSLGCVLPACVLVPFVSIVTLSASSSPSSEEVAPSQTSTCSQPPRARTAHPSPLSPSSLSSA